MTLKQQKKRKVGILQAMMIVNHLQARKAKTIPEVFKVAHDAICILHKLRIVSSQPIPRFKKGSLAIVGENKKEEIIIKP